MAGARATPVIEAMMVRGPASESEGSGAAPNAGPDAVSGAGPDAVSGAGYIDLCAPTVGLWRDIPAVGTLIRPGDGIGHLQILGVLHRLVAPAGAGGMVAAPYDDDDDDATADDAERRADARAEATMAQRPVAFGTRLLRLDVHGSLADVGIGLGDAVGPGGAASAGSGMAFRAPMSGRCYLRPAPDREVFINVGDEIDVGRTVCLLEVMKTFNRIAYGGGGLPDKARVRQIVPKDGDDLASGDVILLLEAL